MTVSFTVTQPYFMYFFFLLGAMATILKENPSFIGLSQLYRVLLYFTDFVHALAFYITGIDLSPSILFLNWRNSVETHADGK